MSDAPDTIPSCVGLGTPHPPSKCDGCNERELCKDLRRRFVPRETLVAILEKVERLEGLLKGG